MMEYTAAETIRAIAATVAPFTLVPAAVWLLALICPRLPHLFFRY